MKEGQIIIRYRVVKTGSSTSSRRNIEVRYRGRRKAKNAAATSSGEISLMLNNSPRPISSPPNATRCLVLQKSELSGPHGQDIELALQMEHIASRRLAGRSPLPGLVHRGLAN